MGGKTGTKAVYFDKLKGLLEEYKSIFIVCSGELLDGYSALTKSTGQRRQCLVATDARDPQQPPRRCRRPDGQEHHGPKSAEGFPRRQP
jgi:hypothetical protein